MIDKQKLLSDLESIRSLFIESQLEPTVETAFSTYDIKYSAFDCYYKLERLIEKLKQQEEI